MMNAKKLLLCSLCCSAFAVTAAQAQSGGNGAGMSGATAASGPRGELSTANQDKGGGPRGAAATSTTTRAEVKADAARSAGSGPRGELSTPNQDKGGGPRMAASGSGKGKRWSGHRRAASSASAMSPSTTSDPAITQGERTPPQQRKDTPRP